MFLYLKGAHIDCDCSIKVAGIPTSISKASAARILPRIPEGIIAEIPEAGFVPMRTFRKEEKVLQRILQEFHKML